MRQQYNKLVRDRIPEIIRKSGLQLPYFDSLRNRISASITTETN